MVCCDDVIMGENMNTIMKSTESLLEASREVGLEVTEKKGLKFNGAHQLLVCANDVHIVGKNISTVMKNICQKLVEGVGIEVNTKKNKYMLMSHH
jgi:hypothetical protein